MAAIFIFVCFASPQIQKWYFNCVLWLKVTTETAIFTCCLSQAGILLSWIGQKGFGYEYNCENYISYVQNSFTFIYYIPSSFWELLYKNGRLASDKKGTARNGFQKSSGCCFPVLEMPISTQHCCCAIFSPYNFVFEKERLTRSTVNKFSLQLISPVKLQTVPRGQHFHKGFWSYVSEAGQIWTRLPF